MLVYFHKSFLMEGTATFETKKYLWKNRLDDYDTTEIPEIDDQLNNCMMLEAKSFTAIASRMIPKNFLNT